MAPLIRHERCARDALALLKLPECFHNWSALRVAANRDVQRNARNERKRGRSQSTTPEPHLVSGPTLKMPRISGAMRGSARFGQRTSWVLGVAYVIRSLCFPGRCREAYDHLHGTMLARAGRGRRVAKFAWYDLTPSLRRLSPLPCKEGGRPERSGLLFLKLVRLSPQKPRLVHKRLA